VGGEDDTDAAVLTDVIVSVDDFLLGEAVAAAPELRFELVRVVPIGPDPIPLLQVYGDQSGVMTTLEADDDVANVEAVARFADEGLYAIVWTGDGVPALLAGLDCTLVAGETSGTNWHLRLRFPRRPLLSEFDERCRETGADVTFETVTEPQPPVSDPPLSELQRETLLRAVQRGYYRVPREASLAELAEEFDVSDQAISQRLRRGIDSLVRATLDDRP
jgi:hypothetical protein